MEVLHGAHFIALRGESVFTELQKWCKLRGLRVIKAYAAENPGESFSITDIPILVKVNKDLDWTLEINPTHQVFAYVTRYPLKNSGLSIFMVEAEKIKQKKTRTTKRPVKKTSTRTPARKS